jgi:hypothetical protein
MFKKIYARYTILFHLPPLGSNSGRLRVVATSALAVRRSTTRLDLIHRNIQPWYRMLVLHLGLLHYSNLKALNATATCSSSKIILIYQVSAGDNCLRLYLPLCQEAGHSPS